MDPEFKEYFIKFAKANYAYIVTGSDYGKTFEQMGEAIAPCQISYNCSGNSVHVAGTEMYRNDWVLEGAMRTFFEGTLERHPYSEKTGLHLEDRPGMCNFSIVGRNATPELRARYVEYDLKTKDRETIANKFNKVYVKHGIKASVAGETGLDIMPLDAGKAQILADFEDISEVIFFGDKCMPGGNDHDIASEVSLEGMVHNVDNYNETWQIMKGYWNDK